jgi:hypothetical protein
LPGHRVLRVPLDRGSQAKRVVLAERLGGPHRDHAMLGERQRPGLVEDDSV